MKHLKPGSGRMIVGMLFLAGTIGCMAMGIEAGARMLAFQPGPT